MMSVVPLILLGTLAAASNLRNDLTRDYFAPSPARKSGIQYFPGIVSLHNAGEVVCAGSVFDWTHVVTSGWCGTLLKGAKSTVRSGSSYAPSGGRVHDVVNITVHPHFDKRRYDYDVAVVTVDSAHPFEGTEVVELAKPGTELQTYQPLKIYGWGFPTRNENFSVEVQPFVSRAECNQILSGSFSPVKLVTPRMLCTLKEPRYPKTSNFGSPVISADKKQVAISSWNRDIPDDIVTMQTDITNKEIQEFIRASL